MFAFKRLLPPFVIVAASREVGRAYTELTLYKLPLPSLPFLHLSTIPHPRIQEEEKEEAGEEEEAETCLFDSPYLPEYAVIHNG